MFYVMAVEDGVPRVVAEYANERDGASDFPTMVSGTEAEAELLDTPLESLAEAGSAYLQEQIELAQIEKDVLQDHARTIQDEIAFLRSLLGES